MYWRRMCDLWTMLSVVGMTALVPFTVTALAMGVLATPFDAAVSAPPNRVNESLQARLDQAEGLLEEERIKHQATRVELDQIRRGAIWFPRKGDVAGADLIPPQNLPIPECRE